MAGKNIYNNKDSMEINELASLNEDISDDLLERLQQKVLQESGGLSSNTVENDDSTLFEEPSAPNENISTQASEEEISKNESDEKQSQNDADNYNDSFIAKYKSKLNKTADALPQEDDNNIAEPQAEKTEDGLAKVEDKKNEEPIEKVTNGNITERLITKEQKEYNDSLDFLDGNVKYSKYVIYIDPKNVDFIESLTVKERKTLINNILKNQHDIETTKKKLNVAQHIVLHIIIFALTLAISLPLFYNAFNISLEATIDNYRRSQSNFKVLYKENGKITNIRK